MIRVRMRYMSFVGMKQAEFDRLCADRSRDADYGNIMVDGK